MPDQTQLGPRAIRAYNRLARDIAALNYVVHFAKPAGTIGDTTRRELLAAIHTANRLFKREPARARFMLFDPIKPMSLFDFTLHVAKLTAAANDFEARHAHLTEAGIKRAAIEAQSAKMRAALGTH